MLNNFFVARQPIFDSFGKLWAFELLFRTGLCENIAVIDDPDAANCTGRLWRFFTRNIRHARKRQNFHQFHGRAGFSSVFRWRYPRKTRLSRYWKTFCSPQSWSNASRNWRVEGYMIALDDVGDPGYKDIFPTSISSNSNAWAQTYRRFIKPFFKCKAFGKKG